MRLNKSDQIERCWDHRTGNPVQEWWAKQPLPYTCYYCDGGPLDRELRNKHSMRATLDHKIPMHKHGSSNPHRNGVVACYPCNRDKGVLMPDEFMAVIKYRQEKPQA